MKAGVLLICLFLSGITGLSAQQIPPELRLALQKNARDTSQVWDYMEAARYFYTNQLDSGIFYLDQALELAKQIQFSKGQAAALLRLTGLYRMAGQPDRAVQFEQEALQLAANTAIGEFAGKIYELKGNNMIDALEPDSAFYYFSLAEKANLNAKMPYRNFSVYLGFSHIFRQEEKNEKAEEYLLKAYDLSKTKRLRKDHGMVLYFLMDFYFSGNALKKYSTYATEYVELTGNEQSALSVNPMHQFLYVFDESESVESKIFKMEQVIEAQLELGHERNLAISYDYLCELQKEIQDWEGALFSALQGLAITQKIGHLNEETAFTEIIADIYHQKGDHLQAYLYLQKTNVLKDSLHFFESQRNREALEVQFETEKKETALKLSQLELAREESQQRLLALILVLVGILALITLGFLYFKSRTNKILLEKNNIIGIALGEKETLLREIHHRVKNNLQVVSSLLNLQSKTLEDAQAKAAITEGQNRVRSMALIHQNLYQVNNLTTVDIRDYIEKLTQNLFNAYNIRQEQITLNTDIDALQIDVETLVPLGLILNEVLSNSLKHAFPDERSGTIDVTLKKETAALVLNIKDNGVGFQTSEQKISSFGLMLIQDFARKLQADLNFNTQQGTDFTLRIQHFQLAN